MPEARVWISEICPKCGKRSLEFRPGDLTLVCIYDGWVHYLSHDQVEILRQGLDKTKCGHQNIN